MRMTTAPNLTQDPNSFYDPDEVLPQNSPILAAHKLKLHRSPTPPPLLSAETKARSSRSPRSRRRRSSRRGPKPSLSDAFLVSLLDEGRHPEIATIAGNQVLPPGSEDDESPISESSESSRGSAPLASPDRPGGGGEGRGERSQAAALDSQERQGRAMTTTDSKRAEAGTFDLKSLARGALAFTQPAPRADTVDPAPARPVSGHGLVKEKRHATSIPPAITTTRTARGDPLYMEDGSVVNAGPSSFSPRSSIYSPRDLGHRSQHSADHRSPTLMPPNTHGGLAPIQSVSPRSETNGLTSLPSIRMQLGDWADLKESAVDRDGKLRHPTFSQSPPATLRFTPLQTPHHGSPPISPVDALRREPPSPGHALAPPSGISPFNYYHQSNVPHRQTADYSSSSNTATPNTDQSGSTPATSITDRLSIDGLTNPANGTFVCNYPGCNAAPFQTQYLLNSHANVHSSIRPHYCSVQGCTRSEGGKGFKRKNEMIRHGLVHESPGYVCPFCPDREHKYPRPDNLQRHVRVHHTEKDKDDPQLRDVLSQRPDGPNRGRRRRGPN